MTLKKKILNEIIKLYPQGLSIERLMFLSDCSLADCIYTIDKLEKEGFPIKRKNNSLYARLPFLSTAELLNKTKELSIGHTYFLEAILPSTNTFALKHLSTLTHGTVILTHYQSKGKGRLSRQWTAPPGKAIALSIVLKPTVKPEAVPLLTQLTAAALCLSLKKYGDVKIKWPNDLIFNGKKVAGILVESHFQANQLQGLVVGVGVNTNLSLKDFDETLQSKATSLRLMTQEVINPNTLITEFLTYFNSFYSHWSETLDSSSFISVCKNESLLIDTVIHVHSPTNPTKRAVVKDINPLGELIIQYDGEESSTPLTSLDFSIRGLDSYI